MKDRRDDPGAIRWAGAGPTGKPATVASLSPQSSAEIVLNCAGFLVGLLIMTGDYLAPGRSPQEKQFLHAPKAMVWIFIVAAEFAFWANILEPLWRRRSRLRMDYQLRFTREIGLKLAAACVLFFGLPGYFLIRIVPDSNLAHQDAKLFVVNLVAMIVALLAVDGIWYVRAALDATFAGKGPGERPGPSIPEGVRILHDLRADLQRFITLLGAMIALATLAKGALRQAYLATGGIAEQFPSEYVLLQGAYFTGLLALVYIPTYVFLTTIGANLLETVYPIAGPDLDWENLSKWQANRKSLEGLLRLHAGPVQNLRASVSILAPVATSAIAVLLG